jgi:hypothetical protein
MSAISMTWIPLSLQRKGCSASYWINELALRRWPWWWPKTCRNKAVKELTECLKKAA